MPRTVLVTGATSGIGLETARQIAAQGHRVIVHGRNRERALAAAASIESQGGTPAAVEADLADMRAIHALAQRVSTEHPRLDTLVHNAGVYHPERRATGDGFEETFAVNHLAPFLLTQLLLPTLRTNAPARIVLVASRAHHNASLDLDDVQMEHRPYVGWVQYCNTKLMNILYASALARRLDPKEVTVNAVHPGFVATRLARDAGLLDAGFRLLGMSAARGARTSVHVATHPEVEGRTGLYWVREKVVEPSRRARDEAAAERLWRRSETLLAQVSSTLPRP